MPVSERDAATNKMVASELERYPFLYECHKKDCGYKVAVVSIETGIKEEFTHICPRRIALKEGRLSNVSALTAINEAWEMMDRRFADLKTLQAGDPRQELISSELSGMANVLVLMMRPYYNTRDDLVREVVARYSDNLAGIEHVTPGVGHIALMPEEGGSPWSASIGGGYTSDPASMIEPPYGYPQDRIDAATARERERTANQRANAGRTASSAPSRTTTAKPANKRSFTEDEVTAIRSAQAAGFDHKMILTAYNCTMEDLREILLPA